MSENAFVFFTLLNESYRLEAQDRLEDIVVTSVPHMEGSNSKSVIDSYKRQADDILDLFSTENVSSAEEIKEALNQ